jgi:hypothetical protein
MLDIDHRGPARSRFNPETLQSLTRQSRFPLTWINLKRKEA